MLFNFRGDLEPRPEDENGENADDAEWEDPIAWNIAVTVFTVPV